MINFSSSQGAESAKEIIADYIASMQEKGKIRHLNRMTDQLMNNSFDGDLMNKTVRLREPLTAFRMASMPFEIWHDSPYISNDHHRYFFNPRHAALNADQHSNLLMHLIFPKGFPIVPIAENTSPRSFFVPRNMAFTPKEHQILRASAIPNAIIKGIVQPME